MLLLAVKPCSDGINSEHLDGISIELEHDHSTDSDDNCPTTCVCKCCGATITFVPAKRIVVPTDPLISTVVFCNYPVNYLFEYQSNIWQPPRMTC